MKRWVGTLGSLKLTVILVLVIGVVLAAGTIKESLHGAEAGRVVYYSPWFIGLQGLFAMNCIAALITRWPRNRWRIGFAVTHTAMLIILGGALVTAAFKVEGQLPLFEGQSSSVLLQQPKTPDGKPGEVPLGFQIRLDDFQIDTYQGTMRPAMFRSMVTVIDPRTGQSLPGIIQMNHPLAYGGFHFFQSSYQQQDGREMSVLSVSKDPGQPIVFFGYTLLVAGMIVVFATRLTRFQLDQKEAAALRPAARPSGAGLAAKTAAAVALLLLAAGAARAAYLPDAATTARLRVMAVQHDGRTMPFDTQAREEVWKVTGLRAWPGIDPVAMAAGWSFDVQGWIDQPIVKVGDAKLAEAIGVDGRKRWASFRELAGNGALRQLVQQAEEQERSGKKLVALEKSASALYERLQVLDEVFSGGGMRVLPGQEARAAWSPAPVKDAASVAAIAEGLRSGQHPDFYPTQQAIDRELLYNKVRPTRLAWLFLLPAALAAALTQTRNRYGLRLVATVGIVLGFLAMTWGIALRWQIAGRIPASNMYESMLFLGWGVGLFAIVAVLLRQRLLIANAAGMGALAMMLADLLPIDGFVHPVAPVLSGTPWLAIHVPIIVISYSVLAMATGLAHLELGATIFAPQRRDLVERFSQLLYWYLHVGSILLIAGILTGSIWAASSWGRYWGWDPKEVWSLVAFLAYMAILHARFDGQIRSFGVAVASIAAFWTILMTYLGVNYVLATGLHAYGFGSSNLVTVMVGIAGVEAAFLLAAWNANRKAPARPAPAIA